LSLPQFNQRIMSMYDDPQLNQLYKLLHKKNNQLRLENKTNAILQNTVLFQQEIINETEKRVSEAFEKLKERERKFYEKFDKNMYEATAKHVIATAEKLAAEKFDGIANNPDFQSKMRLMVAKLIEEFLKD